MIANIHHYLYMGGYAFYVWSAYGSVLAYLVFQWLAPRRKWKKLLQDQADE